MDRFWSKVAAPDARGCRVWTGGRSSSGYGVISVRGRQVRAHRLAFELAHGPIPAGQLVLHRCDVPACVEPSHLFVGSHADNVSDREAKGRTGRGERSVSPLTTADVVEIRARAAAGSTYTVIAEAFGVSRPAVAQIVKRRTWAHV